MKKTAGFLKACATFVVIIEILAAVIVAIAGVALLMAGSFSSLAERTGNAITVNGGTMTPAEMDALKPVVLLGVALALVTIVMALLGTLKVRKALNECKLERPFSTVCAESVKASARFEIIGGIVGIIGGVILATMASSLKVNGASMGSTSISFNLGFLFYAVEKYLLYHIAEYGHSLETNQDRL